MKLMSYVINLNGSNFPEKLNIYRTYDCNAKEIESADLAKHQVQYIVIHRVDEIFFNKYIVKLLPKEASYEATLFSMDVLPDNLIHNYMVKHKIAS
jgi:hypothetical protein